MRITNFTVAAVLLIATLSSCSLLTDKAVQERLTSTDTVFSPGADCANQPPLCVLDYDGVLTGFKLDTLFGGPNLEVYPRYSFDSGAQNVALRYLPEGTSKLDIGVRYRLNAQLQQFFSLGSIGSVQFTDDEGLKLFVMNLAVSRDSKNPKPPTGWTVSQSGSAVGAEDRGCGVSGRPTLVTFVHGGFETRLYQGNSATIGNFDVTVLAAEEVDYSNADCLDFALTELSYVIARKS